MKPKMKAFAFMLVALTMLLVTACSGSGGNTAQPPQEQPKTEAPKEEPKKEEPKEEPKSEKKELPAFDMGGEPVRFLTWGKGPEEGKSNAEDIRYKRMKEIEKKYNTKIEWITIPWGEGAEKIAQGALSGEAPADFVILDLYLAFPNLPNKGYLLPVDDLFDYNDPKWPKRIKEFSSFAGKSYGILEDSGAGAGIFFNRSMLKREGLEDPQELAKKGEWTWDKYLEMAKKATKDTNGDGATDQWGIVSYAPVQARQAVYSNAGSIIDYKDGKLQFTLGEPNAMEALRFLGELYTTHKVAMPNRNGNFEDYNESQKVFNSGKALFVPGEIWEGSTRQDMTDEYGFVYYPKGPKATDYANPITNFTMWFMPANVKKAKEKAQIFEDMVPWDQLEEFRMEGFESSLQSPEDVEIAQALAEKVQPLYYDNIGNLGQKYTEAVLAFVKGKDTPESAIEKIKKSSQEQIDTIMNKK